jgi:hypothetical protein
MNDNIINEIKQSYTNSVTFESEHNIKYPYIDVNTNTLTHYIAYLAPDNNLYTNKTEYESTL